MRIVAHDRRREIVDGSRLFLALAADLGQLGPDDLGALPFINRLQSTWTLMVQIDTDHDRVDPHRGGTQRSMRPGRQISGSYVVANPIFGL